MTADLNQVEAEQLLVVEKHKVNSTRHDYPQLGGKLEIPLMSIDGREKFILDVSRRKIELSRNKFQTRARECIVLARLDLDDTPHRNPDGEDVPGPHLHIYREGYGDSWALPLSDERYKTIFSDPKNCIKTLEEFMRWCEIIDPPCFHGGLFI